MTKINAAFKEKCRLSIEQFVQQRIDRYKQQMDSFQAAANNETKSSAGDKFETGRAMMQMEKDKTAAQLNEALKVRKVLPFLQRPQSKSAIGLGHLVETSMGLYYLSASAGRLVIDDVNIIAISGGSPLGQQFLGKKIGDQITFNRQQSEIKQFL